MNHVYVVLVNYNRWEETVECLESLFKLHYTLFKVIVVDNASPNDSLSSLVDWAKGKKYEFTNLNPKLAQLVLPPIQKPIPYRLLTQSESEIQSNEPLKERLIFIKANLNKGFSAGNNIALRFASKFSDCDYFWLLNNDTIVEPESLSYLVDTFSGMKNPTTKIGILGSKTRYYDRPERLQCAGGSWYNRWTSETKLIGNNEIDKGQYDTPLSKIDFINGSSMFISRAFLEDVGFLCEEYFLYFEEIDWAERAKRKGWALGYDWRAKIYHKEGASTGSNLHKEISFFSEFLFQRNKLIFTKKFFSIFNISTIYLTFLLHLMKRLFKGEIEQLKTLSRLFVNPYALIPDKSLHNHVSSTVNSSSKAQNKS